MLNKLRQAELIWPTLAALARLTVLLGLGTWQLERKRWKEDLLAKIAARVDRRSPSARTRRADSRAAETTSSTCTYPHPAASITTRSATSTAPAPSGLAWQVYTPLEVAPAASSGSTAALVPDANKAPATRAAGQVPVKPRCGASSGCRRTRPCSRPQNDVAGNLWYWPDITCLDGVGLSAPARVTALPFTVEADAQPAPPGGLPKGGVTRIALPNRHLEYAVTWYGIALTLIGVYLAFAVSRLRASPARMVAATPAFQGVAGQPPCSLATCALG